MIQEQTYLKVADNSGGKIVKCIKVLNGTNKKYANIGEIIKVVVKTANFKSKIKKSQVLKAMIIRSKTGIKRLDGTIIKFNDNSVILLNNNEQIISTRVFGIILRELKNEKFAKLISLSNEII
ncbi:ribosomal protein L14 [Candidatus Carsonella ruddii PV]|uniref:Large ribosomal subunit protein uL14 n=1 Tax=Carsonella ruddii (strain PV) TaxID=387662 RepID=RL14_CARRP|nr:50S ribosomal protein L14 [Candidatus Carsonella ruddii]Q05FJ3.1 RecName: Full=Large ribosomal subunit protein uL14; AltName: Full=50S ribosomal protein L14 [Candidatus Carsonella ruddii PV]BAF35178.1 ribosomal protein L14 [Candidatus Carsonella ruddii PV]